jgi:diaminopimelate decarboxylase
MTATASTVSPPGFRIGGEGLSLDTCSAGEPAVAQAVGFPAERVLLHGNAKTPDDLRAAA